MQLFSKKNAKIILAVLVAICLAGCATKAPVEEVVVAPVVEAPVVEVPVVEVPVVEVVEPAPAPAPAPAPVAVAPVDMTPVVDAVEAVAKAVVKSAVGPLPVVPAVDKIEAPKGDATYIAEYSVVGYNLVFKAIDNFVVFNYIETLSNAQNAVAADNIAAMLPNVVEYGVAAPGSIVVEMSKPITSAEFNSFVEKMCNKAYAAIYPTTKKAFSYVAAPVGAPTYAASYSVAGYKLAFKSIGNSLVFNYVDAFTADEAENALRNLSAKLPYVVSCGIAGPGSMVFNMSQPISKSAFSAFVDYVSEKAYKAIYPSNGKLSSTFEMYGYKFVFTAENDVVEVKFIDVLSDAQKVAVAEAFSAILPNVVDYEIGIGSIAIRLGQAVNGYNFDKLVNYAVTNIENDLNPVCYEASYEVGHYKLAFRCVNNVIVFNYVDNLSDAELRDAATSLAAMLPNVADYGVAGPGIMVFELANRPSEEVFNNFVSVICAAAYDVIY